MRLDYISGYFTAGAVRVLKKLFFVIYVRGRKGEKGGEKCP